MCWFDLSEYYLAWLDQTAGLFDIRPLTNHSQEARVLLNEESVDKQKTTVLKFSVNGKYFVNGTFRK